MPLPCAVALREGFIGVFKERLSLGTIRKYNAHDQNGHIFLPRNASLNVACGR